MKTKVAQLSLAAGMLALMSGVVHAKNSDDNGSCRNSTLRGLYAFHATGFNVVAGVPQPKAIVELINFHGDGNLDVPAATVSINGVVGRSPPRRDRDLHRQIGLHGFARISRTRPHL
jgi:hypothetical protein